MEPFVFLRIRYSVMFKGRWADGDANRVFARVRVGSAHRALPDDRVARETVT